MAEERTESLEREIEETRERLAATIDQLVDRTSPKNVGRREVAAAKAVFVDADGNPRTENILKVVGGVVGAAVLFAVVRRVASD